MAISFAPQIRNLSAEDTDGKPGWYVVDDIDKVRIGPFPTRTKARAALADYCLECTRG